MSWIKFALRFVLALFAFVVLLTQFAVLFTPPDPFTQLIAMGVATLVSTPIAVIFVRRSYSLERLYGFLLALYVSSLVVMFPVFGALFALDATTGVTILHSGFGWAVVQALLLFVVYALAFHLVYRGGYARLNTRLA